MIGNVGLNDNKSVIMLSNLSFDHPLSNIELLELQNLLISGIPLGQIYFKDNVDINTIEKIKLLLEGLPNVNDASIDKYIMKDINDSEKELLTSMNFINIDSWNISYLKEGNKYSITSLSKYRKIEEWLEQVIYDTCDENLSQLEKVCLLYDKVKMLEFDTNHRYDRIPEIIEATSYGYNLVFKELLMRCNIPSVISKISNEEDDNYITLAIINDEKHGINGLYTFDPSMDTIFKDQYKNNLARKMNYNFFCVNMDQLQNIYLKRNMYGILKILSSDDLDEFKHWKNLYESKNENEELDKVKATFGMSIDEIYSKSVNTNTMLHDTMIKIITKSLEKYPDNVINKEWLKKAISDNYHTRNSELFSNEYVKKKQKVDI